MARTYGRVTLASESPKITVTAVLIAPVTPPLPQPKYDNLERYGFYDLPKYAGQLPFALSMQIKFEDRGRSVEDDIRRLEELAERPEGRDAPPDVEITGPVPHATLRWRVVAPLEENVERTVYDVNGDRTFAVMTVNLIQRVTETTLSASLTSSKQAKGIGTTTKVRRGESDLYDVAQRFYHDSSFALAISKANPVKGNPMPLGTRLAVNQTLRMP